MTFEEIRKLTDEEAIEAVACIFEPKPKPPTQLFIERGRFHSPEGVWELGRHSGHPPEIASSFFWRTPLGMNGILAMRLEEKLRERFEYCSFTYKRFDDHGHGHCIDFDANLKWDGPTDESNVLDLRWPITVSPCRVRVDAFLVAFSKGDE